MPSLSAASTTLPPRPVAVRARGPTSLRNSKPRSAAPNPDESPSYSRLDHTKVADGNRTQPVIGPFSPEFDSDVHAGLARMKHFGTGDEGSSDASSEYRCALTFYPELVRPHRATGCDHCGRLGHNLEGALVEPVAPQFGSEFLDLEVAVVAAMRPKHLIKGRQSRIVGHPRTVVDVGESGVQARHCPVSTTEPDYPRRVGRIGQATLREDLRARLSQDSALEMHLLHIDTRFKQVQIDPGRSGNGERVDVDP